MTVEAILFDMDGVIVDSMRCHADSWKTVFAEYGIVLEDYDIFRREGMSGRQSIDEIFREKRRPVPADDAFQELLRKKHELFEQCAVGTFPLVGDIMAWTESRGIRSALVTGSLLRSVRHVMPPAILSLFGAVITAEDVARGKPDPEPYIRALESLGARPDRALIIENSPMGVRSARAAGITCFALETTLPGSCLSKADRIFRSHEDLFRYLQSNIR